MLFKKPFIVLLLTLISGLIMAQDFSIGLRDGITFSSISGRYDFKNLESTKIEKATGHCFGLIFNYQISKSFILQTEINIEEKGFEFEAMLIGAGLKGNYRLKYITIPLIVNFEIGKKVKFYGYIGTYFGILLKSSNYTSFSTLFTSGIIAYDLSYDPSHEFNDFEFGGLVGLGTKIPLGDKVKFIIDVRYNAGLTKAAKNTDYDYDSNNYTEETPNNFQNVYNRSFTFSLGILYQLERKK